MFLPGAKFFINQTSLTTPSLESIVFSSTLTAFMTGVKSLCDFTTWSPSDIMLRLWLDTLKQRLCHSRGGRLTWNIRLWFQIWQVLMEMSFSLTPVANLNSMLPSLFRLIMSIFLKIKYKIITYIKIQFFKKITQLESNYFYF